jgi:hypothetical protein
VLVLVLMAGMLCGSCSPAFYEAMGRGMQNSGQASGGTRPSLGGSTSQKCPVDNASMWFTGNTTVSDYGRLMQEYQCPMGHGYWIAAPGTPTPVAVKDPCPACGFGTYFTGETVLEMGALLKVYECPAGHRSVKR